MKCSLCDSDNIKANIYILPLELKNKTIETNVFRCNSCGTHFRDVDYSSQELKEHFDVASYTLLQYEKKWKQMRKLFFLDLLSKVENSLGRLDSKKLLDVGCSYGHMMEIFKNNGGFTVCGVEINDVIRQRLTNNGYKVFKDIEELSGDKFNVIALIDSLYYFNAPVPLLKKIYSLLDDNGLLLIRVTNRAWIANLYCLLGMRVPEIVMGDAKYSVSYKGMKELFRRTGFAIEKVFVTEKGKQAGSVKKWLFYKFTQFISESGIVKISPGLIFLCRKREDLREK